MSQIFYIEHGSYSDYSVYGVAPTRELADQWAEHLNRNRRQYEDPYEVSEGWLLDSPPVLVTRYHMYVNCMSPDDVITNSTQHSIPSGDRGQNPTEVRQNNEYGIGVVGYDFADVERVFNELREQWQPRPRTSSS